MPISNTTAKDFENLISYLNSCWNVLSDSYRQFFHYLHSFTPKNGCKLGQYKGPKRPKNRVFGLLQKIESLVFARNHLKWSVLWLANFLHKCHVWENSRSRELEQKAPKKGKNMVFGLLCKIESLVFDINDLKSCVLCLANFLCANLITGKICILEIYVRKLSTNQIAWFFKLLYLLNRSTVSYNFLHKDRIP